MTVIRNQKDHLPHQVLNRNLKENCQLLDHNQVLLTQRELPHRNQRNGLSWPRKRSQSKTSIYLTSIQTALFAWTHSSPVKRWRSCLSATMSSMRNAAQNGLIISSDVQIVTNQSHLKSKKRNKYDQVSLLRSNKMILLNKIEVCRYLKKIVKKYVSKSMIMIWLYIPSIREVMRRRKIKVPSMETSKAHLPDRLPLSTTNTRRKTLITVTKINSIL